MKVEIIKELTGNRITAFRDLDPETNQAIIDAVSGFGGLGYGMQTKIEKKIDVMANDYLRKEDLMEIFGISSQKALQLMKSDLLDSIKIGKTYFTRKVWLDAFVERYKNQEVFI